VFVLDDMNIQSVTERLQHLFLWVLECSFLTERLVLIYGSTDYLVSKLHSETPKKSVAVLGSDSHSSVIQVLFHSYCLLFTLDKDDITLGEHLDGNLNTPLYVYS